MHTNFSWVHVGVCVGTMSKAKLSRNLIKTQTTPFAAGIHYMNGLICWFVLRANITYVFRCVCFFLCCRCVLFARLFELVKCTYFTCPARTRARPYGAERIISNVRKCACERMCGCAIISSAALGHEHFKSSCNYILFHALACWGLSRMLSPGRASRSTRYSYNYDMYLRANCYGHFLCASILYIWWVVVGGWAVSRGNFC